jgi:predicted small integral membrane protein
MTNPHQESGSDVWTERYEQLRQHALGQPASGPQWFFGLEALLQNGMAVWMRAAPPHDPARKETATVAATGDWLAASQRETTRVLAEMAWPQLFQIQEEELNGK